MWVRRDVPSLANSSGLKYEIIFTSSDHSLCNQVAVEYYELGVAWLKLDFQFKDASKFKDCTKLLEDYPISFSDSTNGRLKIEVTQETCKEAYTLLDLSAPCFLDALNFMSQLVVPTHNSFFPQMMFNKRKKEIEEKSINELAEHFDCWMKRYKHNEKCTHNEELIAWLIATKSGKYIKNYERFCKLAEELEKKGYSTNVPPVESEFNEAMNEYDENERSFNPINFRRY